MLDEGRIGLDEVVKCDLVSSNRCLAGLIVPAADFGGTSRFGRLAAVFSFLYDSTYGYYMIQICYSHDPSSHVVLIDVATPKVNKGVLVRGFKLLSRK